MEFNRRTFDFSDTEVHFLRCDARFPFKNPSDAAIARLSARKGFTLDAVQAVLDLIVFNPLFDSRQVTFTSASNIDETVSEHREAQVLRRTSVEGEETSPTSGATSPRAISLVVSQIERDMEPFSEFVHNWVLLDRLLRIARNMSLVHRSWTVPAQGLLFHRILIYSYYYQAIRNLLQNPFCSTIRELHLAVKYTADDGLHVLALLLRRLTSLRKLSLYGVEDGRYSKVDHDNLWAKTYSEILPRLPNRVELRIHHDRDTRLEDCVKRILQCGSGAAPFVLKGISISTRDGPGFVSEILLSPANDYPIVRHETPYSTYSSPQARNSGKISKCPITVSFLGSLHPGSSFARLFDTGGVFEDVYSNISHFDLQHVDWNPPLDDTGTDRFLVRFLRRCTSMTNMDVFDSVCRNSSQEMTYVPFSCISKSLQVLSIYFPVPVDADAQDRVSGLERVVRTMRDREAGSSLERIELIFCPGLDGSLAMGPHIPLQALQRKSIEMTPPKYLDPVRRMCHEQCIDLVCKLAE